MVFLVFKIVNVFDCYFFMFVVGDFFMVMSVRFIIFIVIKLYFCLMVVVDVLVYRKWRMLFGNFLFFYWAVVGLIF